MPREREGSLQWDDGRQTWKVRVTITHADGSKSRPWYLLDTRDRTIAEQKRRALVTRLGQAGAAPVQPRKLEPYALDWHEDLRKGKVAQAESEIGWIKNHILPFRRKDREPTLGEMHLGDINTELVEAMLRQCATKGLGRGTLVKVRWTMRAIMRRAKKEGLIPSNPVDDADIPKTNEVEKQRTIPTDEEVVTL